MLRCPGTNTRSAIKALARMGALISFLISAPSAEAQAPKGMNTSIFSVSPTATEISNAKVFEEPLLPIGTPSPAEVRALAIALDKYVSEGRLDNLEPLAQFLNNNPGSPWKLSLLVNLGLMHRHVGRTSRAMEAWESAWNFGKGLKDPAAVALTHRALGELLEGNAGLGRRDQLERWLKEAEGRTLVGLVTEKMSLAKESLAYMKMSPETAFRCGPMALAHLKATASPLAFANPTIEAMLSSEKGTSLAKNQEWAATIGLSLQMAKRAPGSEIPVPCVLHFRTGHFAAAMASRNGRILVQDPFLGDAWMPLAVIDQEASGYALIPSGVLPKGWANVAKAEGETVWGKGAWGPGRPDDTRPDSYRMPSGLIPIKAESPSVAFHANLVSLNLEIPASRYAPTRGPKADVTVTYNQREYGQPQVFDYCNLGAKWTFSFLTCLKDDSTNPDFDVTLCNPGGGGLIFQSRGDGTFLPENYTQAQLIRTPGNTYVIQYLDGQKDFYEIADRAWGLRRLVITRRQDVAGNELKFTWDAMLRLTSITDTSGQVTSLGYELKTDPLKLTKVTDPSGKSTRFEFDLKGQLVRTINPEGGVTTFAYGPTPADPGMSYDFINAMANPAGTILFRSGETLIGPSSRRWLEAEDASGRLERVEGGAGYAYEIDPEQLPRVPELDPAYHPLAYSFRESFFWKAGAYDLGKPNFRKARHIRWGHGPGGFSSGIALSEKEPDGPRHWFVHAGDFWGGVTPLARSIENPLTSEGLLKPGAQLLGAQSTKGRQESIAPVFDGCRRLVTRDYWTNPDGTIRKVQREFDVKGRLVREISPTP